MAAKRVAAMGWCVLGLSCGGPHSAPLRSGGPLEACEVAGCDEPGGEACLAVGHAGCAPHGEFCGDQGVCARPFTDCEASRDSGARYEAGAPVLYAAGPTVLTGSLTPGAGRVPRDTCTDADSRLAAFEVRYFAPQADFPTEDLGLYAGVRFFNAANPAGARPWFTVAGGAPSEGAFVLLLCVLHSSRDEPWAVLYDAGASSAALCFDVVP